MTDRIAELEIRLRDAYLAANQASGPLSLYRPDWAEREPAVKELAEAFNPGEMLCCREEHHETKNR